MQSITKLPGIPYLSKRVKRKQKLLLRDRMLCGVALSGSVEAKKIERQLNHVTVPPCWGKFNASYAVGDDYVNLIERKIAPHYSLGYRMSHFFSLFVGDEFLKVLLVL